MLPEEYEDYYDEDYAEDALEAEIASKCPRSPEIHLGVYTKDSIATDKEVCISEEDGEYNTIAEYIQDLLDYEKEPWYILGLESKKELTALLESTNNLTSESTEEILGDYLIKCCGAETVDYDD